MRFLQTHTQAAYCGDSVTDSSKWCISGRDCPQRCSARRCSMFARPSRRIRRTKKNQQHFELLCGSERLRRLYGRGRWAYLRCGVRGKARHGFQTGGAAEKSACGRAHKGRSHGLLLARLVVSSTKCSVKERAEHRAGAGHNSAALVCCEGKWSLTPCARPNRRRRIWRRPWWPKPRRCYTAGC